MPRRLTIAAALEPVEWRQLARLCYVADFHFSASSRRLPMAPANRTPLWQGKSIMEVELIRLHEQPAPPRIRLNRPSYPHRLVPRAKQL
jgi:hypothetical protein